MSAKHFLCQLKSPNAFATPCLYTEAGFIACTVHVHAHLSNAADFCSFQSSCLHAPAQVQLSSRQLSTVLLADGKTSLLLRMRGPLVYKQELKIDMSFINWNDTIRMHTYAKNNETYILILWPTEYLALIRCGKMGINPFIHSFVHHMTH